MSKKITVIFLLATLILQAAAWAYPDKLSPASFLNIDDYRARATCAAVTQMIEGNPHIARSALTMAAIRYILGRNDTWLMANHIKYELSLNDSQILISFPSGYVLRYFNSNLQRRLINGYDELAYEKFNFISRQALRERQAPVISTGILSISDERARHEMGDLYRRKLNSINHIYKALVKAEERKHRISAKYYKNYSKKKEDLFAVNRSIRKLMSDAGLLIDDLDKLDSRAWRLSRDSTDAQMIEYVMLNAVEATLELEIMSEDLGPRSSLPERLREIASGMREFLEKEKTPSQPELLFAGYSRALKAISRMKRSDEGEIIESPSKNGFNGNNLKVRKKLFLLGERLERVADIISDLQYPRYDDLPEIPSTDMAISKEIKWPGYIPAGAVSNKFILEHIGKNAAIEVREDKEIILRIKSDKAPRRDSKLEANFRSRGIFKKIRKAKDFDLMADIAASCEAFESFNTLEKLELIRIAQATPLSIILGQALIGEGDDRYVILHARTGRSKAKHGLGPTIWIGEKLLDRISVNDLARLILEESKHIMKPPAYISGKWINTDGKDTAKNGAIEHDPLFWNRLFDMAFEHYRSGATPYHIKSPKPSIDTKGIHFSFWVSIDFPRRIIRVKFDNRTIEAGMENSPHVEIISETADASSGKKTIVDGTLHRYLRMVMTSLMFISPEYLTVALPSAIISLSAELSITFTKDGAIILSMGDRTFILRDNTMEVNENIWDRINRKFLEKKAAESYYWPEIAFPVVGILIKLPFMFEDGLRRDNIADMDINDFQREIKSIVKIELSTSPFDNKPFTDMAIKKPVIMPDNDELDTQDIAGMLDNPWMNILFARSESERLRRSNYLENFLKRNHPIKKEIFSAIDALPPDRVLALADEILSTDENSSPDGYGLGHLSRSFLGRYLTLREIFLHVTSGDVDLNQILMTHQDIIDFSTPDILSKYLRSRGISRISARLRNLYVVMKAIKILSARTDIVIFQEADVNRLAKYFTSDSVFAVPVENLWALAHLFIPADTPEKRESLKNFIALIDKLKAGKSPLGRRLSEPKNEIITRNMLDMLNGRFFDDSAVILLSENLFINGTDEMELAEIKSALAPLLANGRIAIMKPEEIRRSVTNQGATRDKLAAVFTREDFEDNNLWNSSDKEIALKASVIIIDDKMTGHNYLYLESVLGLARAVMAGDRQKAAMYYRIISGIAIDDDVLELLSDGRQNNLAFALKTIVRFRPIEEIAYDELEKLKIRMENFLISA
ncbi:MAG: hypothetical protein JXB40_03960 [Candidatus Omnitrophica bacterium]|nr:hypothetical protein [Candidatus Omnitrophota bacterium]